MGKGPGTTKSVGSNSAAAPRTSGGGNYVMGGTFNETMAEGSFNSMRESLSKFAQQNGFSVGFGGVARKTLDGDLGKQNIKSVSIEISQEWHKGGSVSLMYETRITGSKSAEFGSKDFDAYQKAIFQDNGHRYTSLESAYKALNDKVARLNKMVIRK